MSEHTYLAYVAAACNALPHLTGRFYAVEQIEAEAKRLREGARG